MKTSNRIAALVCLLVGLNACTSNKTCRPTTLFVELMFDAATNSSDNLSVVFELNGQSPRTYPISRPGASASLSFAIELGSAYVAGAGYSLLIEARQGTSVVGVFGSTGTLMATCTAVSLSAAPPDGGTVDQSTDVARADAAITDDMTVVTLPDLATPPDLVSLPDLTYVPPPICGSDGWCWDSPRPTGNLLKEIWAASASDVWAVGELGTIIHFDGQKWERESSGTTKLLNDVWGTSATDVWVVGEQGTILHNDGAGWVSVASGTTKNITHVTGTGPNDVWAIDDAATGPGVVFHWNGTAWSEFWVSTAENGLADIWARTPSDVWVVFANNEPYRWNGTSWNLVTGSSGELAAVWGAGPNDVWLGSGVGAVGLWNGSMFDSGGFPGSAVLGSVLKIWGTGANDVWVIAALGNWHLGPTGWSEVLIPGWIDFSTSAFFIKGIGGTPGDTWAVGERGVVLHSVSAGDFTEFRAQEADLRGVSGSSATDIWAVGDGGYIKHSDGGLWHPVPSGVSADLFSVAALSRDNAWAVGSAGTILHWNGVEWTSSPSVTTKTLRGVWGAAPDDVWAVGDDGTILRWQGSEWVTTTSPTGNSLFSVHGTSSSNVFAVGASGIAIRWQGSGWNTTTTNTTAALRSVFASDTGSLMTVDAVGDARLTFSNGSWSIQSGTGMNAVTKPNTVPVVVGNGGLAVWFSQTTASITNRNLYGIWSIGTGATNEAWAVGAAGTIIHRSSF